MDSSSNSTDADEDVDLWLSARGFTPSDADKILTAFAEQREPVCPHAKKSSFSALVLFPFSVEPPPRAPPSRYQSGH